MANKRELSEKSLVSLEAGKLLGLRQLAKVSARYANGASLDLGGSADGITDPRADMSRLFSKIGAEAGPATKAADFRAQMSRLFSKIGIEA